MTRRMEWVWTLLLAVAPVAMAQQAAEPPVGPVFVSQPAVPIITPAVRDLPDFTPDPNLFGLEAKRREDFSFIPLPYQVAPRVDPLFQLQQNAPRSLVEPGGFGTPLHNYTGQQSWTSPPDTTGDVGPNHFVQAVNQSVSTVQVLGKNTGAVLKTFTMQSLTTASPCKNGFCDPVVVYDRVADRWLISELPSSGGNVCVYVSTTPDPTGTYYAYTFAVESSLTDFPKYAAWPQNGNAGSYLMGANAGSSGHDLFAFDRAKMLQGLPATFQKFTVPDLPNSGFQLVIPANMEGGTPPPNGEPAIFMRPHDDEAQENANTPNSDYMELWALTIDWSTPANSKLQALPHVMMGDYDMTLCGLGGIWNCMPQPNTGQKIDPIREPIQFPLQYRNFGDHQSIVGAFAEDVDGTDHAAMRWFEIRKTGSGNWTMNQEGVVGGEPGVHRSVGSAAMDSAGNIAVAYTRTGTTAPYFPSLYYSGRLASDAPGTMGQGEHAIADATTSNTDNERWGDYVGLGVDPVDDCTFWFTSEYGGGGDTRVAAIKFDQCGCIAVPGPPTASAAATQDNRIDVAWTDSATAATTQYFIFRSLTSGGGYVQVATVPDSSPGVANGASYLYHDDTVSGGTRYFYVVKSADAFSCASLESSEATAVATGECRAVPDFAGVATVSNAGQSTCALSIGWNAGSSRCSGGTVSYSVYRGTSAGFVPSPANRIVAGVTGTGYTDNYAVTYGATYYYIVRAVDSVSGAEDTNTVQGSGVPTGPITSSSWTDTFEGALSGGGFDRAGWTHSALTGTTDWVWSTSQKHDGTHSWFAADTANVSDKVLVSPSFGVGSLTTVTFFHTFSFEGNRLACVDGGTLEYTTDDGATWTVVPDADFTAGGFTGMVSSRTNPLAGKRAWCTGTLGAMTQVVVNLGSDATLIAKNVRLRWHEGDDAASAGLGWYVDTVSVNNAQVIATCSQGSVCAAPAAPSLDGTSGDCNGVNLAWSAGPGSTRAFNVYRGTAAGGPYTKLPGMPVTATTYTDASGAVGTTYAYVVRGACDATGGTESPASNEGTGARGPAGTKPASPSGLVVRYHDTLYWKAVAGASSYDVVRGSVARLLPLGNFTPATDACSANDLAAAKFLDPHRAAPGDADWFLVRSANSCGTGTYDEGSPSQTGSRDAEINASPNSCP